MDNTRLICVYCSSSSNVDPAYFEAATALGAEIARQGYGLVYGGTTVGLMGTVAEAVKANGGMTVGVIPEALHGRGIGHGALDELIITKDMRERKATMEARASAFVALPGGFGTLEELFEILTLKQLGYHSKPVAVLNVNGFYDPLLGLIEHIYEQRFARPDYRALYHFAPDVADLFGYLAAYQPPELRSKWS